MSKQELVDRVRHLLQPGEEVVVSESVENSIVAVTNKRVVVFSPESPDTRFYAEYLPNVTGVSVQSGGEAASAMKAIRTGVYAVLLLGAGMFVDLGGIIDPISAPSGIGISGILSAINSFIVLLGFLDEVLLLVGFGVSLVTGWFVFRYWQSREQAISIDVAGDDPITVPIGRMSRVDASVEQLNQAIETASMGQRA